ncbi:MAG: hypothetical protein H6741_11075 [Alphaproteobacteria bacterium]|nr:hypothetical protein [Alphaproteobacteria bacterium]
MDVLDWLKIVLSRCQAVSRVEDALALLPDIGSDAPALVELPVDGGPGLTAPVAFAPALTPALAAVVAQLGEAAARGDASISDPSPDSLIADPLVKVASSLLLEAAVYGPRSASLVVLEVCRQAALMIHGDPSSLRPFGAAEVGRAANAAAALGELNREAQAQGLRGIAEGLFARLAVSHALAGRLDPRVRPGRLYQAIARNKLVLLFPSGSMSFPADAALLAAVEDSRSDSGVVVALHAAILSGVRAALGGADSVAAQSVRDLAGRRKDAESLALDPVIATWVLHSIGDLSDAKVLGAAGVPKDLAKALLKGAGVAAMVASYVDLLERFRAWDLLAAVASTAEPIYEESGRWRAARGALTRRGPWALLGPRGGAGTLELSVVALRRVKLYEAAVAMATERGHPAVLSALEARWRALEDDAIQLGGALDRGGRVWVAAFDEAKAARAFAARVERSFSPRIRLDLGAFGGELSLPDEARVEIAEQRGPVFGGWDGASLCLAGAAVEAAIAQLTVEVEDTPTFDPSSFASLTAASSAPAQRSQPPSADPFSSPGAQRSEPPSADPFSSPGAEAPTDPSGPVAADPFASATPVRSGGSLSLSDPFSEAPTISSEMDDPEDDDPFGFASGGSAQPPEEPDTDESVPPEDRQTLLAAPPFLSEPPPAEDPFQGLPELETEGTLDADPFADPLGGGAMQTLSPDVIAWEGDGDDELFGRDDTEQAPATGGVVSFEIDDDEDSEVSVDMEFSFGDEAPAGDGEDPMFFLPPPKEGSVGSREDEVDLDGSDSQQTQLDPKPVQHTSHPTDLDFDFDADDADDGEPLSFAPPPDARRVAGLDDEEPPRLSGEGDDPFALGSGLAYESIADLGEYSRQLLEEEASDQGVALGDPFGDEGPPEPDPLSELVEPEPAPPEPRKKQSPPPNVLRLSAAEVAYMFNGYVLVRLGEEVVFGRRYGSRIIDAHGYPASQREDKSYLDFVTDKIREGFLPQTDMSRILEGGETIEELNLDLIGRALSDLGTG